MKNGGGQRGGSEGRGGREYTLGLLAPLPLEDMAGGMTQASRDTHVRDFSKWQVRLGVRLELKVSTLLLESS